MALQERPTASDTTTSARVVNKLHLTKMVPLSLTGSSTEH